MRKLLFLLFYFSIQLHLQSIAQDKDIMHINANIEGLPNNIPIYLIHAKDTLATTKSKNHNFEFKEMMFTSGAIYYIKIDTSQTKIGTNAKSWIRLITNNKDFSIKGHFAKWPDVNLTGNEESEDYLIILKNLKEIENKYFTLLNQVPKGDYSKIKELQRLREAEIVKFMSSDDLRSKYGTAIVSKTLNDILSLPGIENIYNSLSKRVKTSFAGITFKEHLDAIKLSETVKSGSTFPSIPVELSSGEITEIHNIISESKFTLIDIWASWCKPCRSAFPKLKMIYEKNKAAGFQIISLSIDTDKNKWIKALEEETLPWQQVTITNENLGKILGYKSIPTYILLDSSGKFISYFAAMGNVQSFGPQIIPGQKLDSTLHFLLNK